MDPEKGFRRNKAGLPRVPSGGTQNKPPCKVHFTEDVADLNTKLMTILATLFWIQEISQARITSFHHGSPLFVQTVGASGSGCPTRKISRLFSKNSSSNSFPIPSFSARNVAGSVLMTRWSYPPTEPKCSASLPNDSHHSRNWAKSESINQLSKLSGSYTLCSG